MLAPAAGASQKSGGLRASRRGAREETFARHSVSPSSGAPSERSSALRRTPA